ncbi:voltage-gated potassium channel [Pseudoalteromonas ulvae UL12]|uniref:Ion transport protein n=1 Tax=Pseudoalteromonas ulvae TaxID=107327 RepID=A0A244CQL8_PSEDV|nr:ion transporter [Pseudoalteromonas ulvae]MBE0365393.1 voltage-gated potassium channel [Pseudoalteromonas ulvae UL12]OUL57868.1 Ion transport protein [Pseudoalteromonas ulvae]
MRAIRQVLAEILEGSGKNVNKGRWLDAVLVLLISINIIAIVLESVSSIAQAHKQLFIWIEIISVAIFTIEYFTRIWVSVDLEQYEHATDSPFKIRIKYMFSPLALIDLIAILPFYLMFFINLDLRFLRALRLLRIFKLTRYSRAMQLLLQSFKEESNSLLAAFFIMAVVLIMASCGIYLLEHDIQPDKFGSIPAAMWWAMATLTTVGYGDVVPITPVGKFFGGVITVLSMGMVAIPTGLLASSFSEQIRKRRALFADHVHAALEDGKITKDELMKLEELRLNLGLSKLETKAAIRNELNANSQLNYCPHCGEKLNH